CVAFSGACVYARPHASVGATGRRGESDRAARSGGARLHPPDRRDGGANLRRKERRMEMTSAANSGGTTATAAAGAPAAGAHESPSPRAVRHWLGRAVKGASEAVGQRYLKRLGNVSATGSLRESMSSVPERIQRVAQQSRLVLELLDDVRSGTYRDLS